MKRWVVIVVWISLLHGASWCPVCGNDLSLHSTTQHRAMLHNGLPRAYCCLRCMVIDAQENGIKKREVRDYSSKSFIDIQNAWYVVGSKQRGVHSKISKIAFKDHSNTLNFVAKYGGEVQDFNTTWLLANQTLPHDNHYEATIKRKKLYPKGRRLYERKCKSFAIDTEEFLEIDELKRYITNQKLCPKLTSDQFQTMALYLWEDKTHNTMYNSIEKIVVTKEEKCPVCGMFTYKYPRWVAQIITIHENHTHRYSFDGVKDLMKFYFNPNKWGEYEEVTPQNIQNILVSDYYSQKAIDARHAFYVIGSDIYGPMGHELIPFEHEEEAKRFKEDHRGQKIIPFDEINEAMVYALDR